MQYGPLNVVTLNMCNEDALQFLGETLGMIATNHGGAHAHVKRTRGLLVLDLRSGVR